MEVYLIYMKDYRFNSDYKTIEKIRGIETISKLEKEVGMYSATPEFLLKHGGSISKNILSKIPQWYFDEAKDKGLYPNIDVRIHRLYPGDYPAYPGWHCDGHFRETYFSQPDSERVKVGKHIICVISSIKGVSNPEFLDEDITLKLNPSADHNLWGQAHKEIEEIKKNRVIKSSFTKEGDIILFNPWTLHRVSPAKKRGWRLFFRMSMWDKPNLGDGGMLTKQEQVYKVIEGSGW